MLHQRIPIYPQIITRKFRFTIGFTFTNPSPAALGAMILSTFDGFGVEAVPQPVVLRRDSRSFPLFPGIKRFFSVTYLFLPRSLNHAHSTSPCASRRCPSVAQRKSAITPLRHAWPGNSRLPDKRML